MSDAGSLSARWDDQLDDEQAYMPSAEEFSVRSAGSGTPDATAMYLRDIAKTRFLSSKEEQELARRLKEGDEEARQQLIACNLRLMVSIAKRFRGMAWICLT